MKKEIKEIDVLRSALPIINSRWGQRTRFRATALVDNEPVGLDQAIGYHGGAISVLRGMPALHNAKHVVVSWNDAPGRKKGDVVALVNLAIARLIEKQKSGN